MPAKTQDSNYSVTKLESIGWLLGRCLVHCKNVVTTLQDDPTHEELVREAKGLIQRWEVEKKIQEKAK